MVKVFTCGIPYAIDTKRLNEAFSVPSLTEGRVIRHDELSAVIATPIGSQRYYGVINSWISQMRNANAIFMTWQPTIGLKVLNPADILHHGETRTRQKVRQTGSAIKIFAWVDRGRLDATGQKRLDHQMEHAAKIGAFLRDERRAMAIELAPVKSLPKPQPIRETA